LPLPSFSPVAQAFPLAASTIAVAQHRLSYDNLRGQAASAHVAEIQAAQERHNAELADVTEQSTLKVAKRYASGRPR